jgi:hypothetical protein
MLPPALSVAGGITMVYLATQTPSALVVDDYARIEELTSERFEQDREALRLGLTGELRFGRDAGRIELSLDGSTPFTRPDVVILALHHATNPAGDVKLSLVRDGSLYIMDTELAPGRYFIELTSPDRTWRLASEARRLDGRIVLRPQTEGV